MMELQSQAPIRVNRNLGNITFTYAKSEHRNGESDDLVLKHRILFNKVSMYRPRQSVANIGEKTQCD
jgi:hypothetical protein